MNISKMVKNKVKEIRANIKIAEYDRLEKIRKELLNKLKTKEKIKVVFLGFGLGAGCDVFSNIYKEFKKDNRFEPYMVIVPNPYGDEANMIKLIKGAEKYLDEMNIPYISGYDEKTKKYTDIIGSINPDVVFMAHHYDFFPKEFRIETFKEKLVYLTPYCYFLVDNLKYQYKTTAYNLAHKCFSETKMSHDMCIEYSLNKKNKEDKFLGYLKADSVIFPEKTHNDVWKIKDKKVKRIIWAPHHLDAELSNFLDYKDKFLDLAKSRPDLQFAIRPHPGLKGSLIRRAGWTDSEVEEYFKQWETLENTFVSEAGFVDLFFTSDAMILDSLSFIAEYLATGKPSFACAPKSRDFKYNAFGNHIRDYLYKGALWEEVLHFIDYVVCGGNDYLKDVREKLFRENFIPKNNQPAYINTYNYVTNEIFGESK